jgi:hypothetical protein
LEYVFDGLICDHWPLNLDGIEEWKRNGCQSGVMIATHRKPLKWHPSYWCAYVRCKWLGDDCGKAILRA